MIAIETLYLTAGGIIVKEGDVRAAFLLCRKGSEITHEAEAIINKAKVSLEAKALLEPSENKAMQAPPNVKKYPRLVRRGKRKKVA